MRLLTLLFAFVCTALVASVADTRPEAQVQQAFPAGGRVYFDLSPGGYTIRAGDSDQITVVYRASSEAQLRDVKATIQITGSIARVSLSNTPHNNFSAEIEVPRQSGLKVRMFAGEVIIDGVQGDKDVQVRTGRIQIRIPNPDEYGEREASVSAGSIEAGAFDVSKGGLFRSFAQSGKGKYRLRAHVTTGEIDLTGTD
jgi:hypothetical protein